METWLPVELILMTNDWGKFTWTSTQITKREWSIPIPCQMVPEFCIKTQGEIIQYSQPTYQI